MAFFKKEFKQLNRKWYPQSVLVGSTVTTDQIAKRLAAESTVSPADVKAVLEALSGVMGDYLQARKRFCQERPPCHTCLDRCRY